jgi:putative membrane protein
VRIEVKEALGWWTLDPLAFGMVGTSTAVYTRGICALWRSAGLGAGIRRGEATAFYLGQLSLLIALASPIDRLSDLLFSAHMAQHEILLIVAPPLIVLGRPIVALAWAFGPQRRTRVMRALNSPEISRFWRFVIAPLIIVLLHGLVLWLWHIPSLDLALLGKQLASSRSSRNGVLLATAAVAGVTALDTLSAARAS